MQKIISPALAYTIASQWGSYVHNNDPGSVFYTFPPGDARPFDEPHRAECLTYARYCLSMARHRSGHADTLVDMGFDLPEHEDSDVDDLASLVAFFECTSLAPHMRAAA